MPRLSVPPRQPESRKPESGKGVDRRLDVLPAAAPLLPVTDLMVCNACLDIAQRPLPTDPVIEYRDQDSRREHLAGHVSRAAVTLPTEVLLQLRGQRSFVQLVVLHSLCFAPQLICNSCV